MFFQTISAHVEISKCAEGKLNQKLFNFVASKKIHSTSVIFQSTLDYGSHVAAALCAGSLHLMNISAKIKKERE